MQNSVRGEALEQLHHAWRDAAIGAHDQAQRHICDVLDILDYTVAHQSESEASLQAARGYIEDARDALVQSDALGVILALAAALKELEPKPEKR